MPWSHICYTSQQTWLRFEPFPSNAEPSVRIKSSRPTGGSLQYFSWFWKQQHPVLLTYGSEQAHTFFRMTRFLNHLGKIWGWTSRLAVSYLHKHVFTQLMRVLTHRSHSHWRWRMSLICLNINSVEIGFGGTLDAYLAITDTMPNPTQHVFGCIP